MRYFKYNCLFCLFENLIYKIKLLFKFKYCKFCKIGIDVN